MLKTQPRVKSTHNILDVAGFTEPVMGQLVSLPERGQPLLNRLALRAGRWLTPGRPDEVVVSEAFAEAHANRPPKEMFRGPSVLDVHEVFLTTDA